VNRPLRDRISGATSKANFAFADPVSSSTAVLLQEHFPMKAKIRGGMSRKQIAAMMLLLLTTTVSAGPKPETEVNAVFHSFIAAQNAHDLKKVGSILLDSPHSLWVARSGAIWGRDAILKRFEQNYHGTWVIKPDYDEVKVIALSPRVVQVFAPASIMISPEGEIAEQHRFLLTQIYVKTPLTWKLASILTLPAP
jgi:uncharacterized protein (TIGR02246 family)